MKNSLSVSIVLPNWNGEHLLRKHLPAVIEEAEGNEVIVVDDASSDTSIEILTKEFPSVKVVKKKNHEGFAGTVDEGVNASKSDIIVLLNTDVHPEKGFLAPLLRHFLDETVFAVGCLEHSHDKEGIVSRGRGVAHWERGLYVHARGDVDKTDTAWVSGGSAAYRKSMWDKLGGMDRIFNPFYWEDIDISYRARKAGWKTLFEPKSVVHHFHEQGKIKSEFTPTDVKRIVYRNQFIFVWKNTDTIMLLKHFIFLPYHMAKAVLRKDTLFFDGFFQALGKTGEILHQRTIQKKLSYRTDFDVSGTP